MKKDIVALTRIWGHHQQSPLFLLLLSNILHTITYWKCKIIVVDISPPLVHWYAQLVTIVLQVDSTVSSVCVCVYGDRKSGDDGRSEHALLLIIPTHFYDGWCGV